MDELKKIVAILSKARIPHSTEEEMQAALAAALEQQGIVFEKEKSLGSRCRVDFFVDGIVIECKTRGNAIQIHRQLERYAALDTVNGVILYTSKFMKAKSEINGKPIAVIHAGIGWL